MYGSPEPFVGVTGGTGLPSSGMSTQQTHATHDPGYNL